MYIDKFIDVARKELAWECDYEREAKYSNFFRYVHHFLDWMIEL